MYRKNKVSEILIIDLNWEAIARRALCSGKGRIGIFDNQRKFDRSASLPGSLLTWGQDKPEPEVAEAVVRSDPGAVRRPNAPRPAVPRATTKHAERATFIQIQIPLPYITRHVKMTTCRCSGRINSNRGWTTHIFVKIQQFRIRIIWGWF